MDMHPACSNKEQNHPTDPLGPESLLRTGFVQKKLKRASLVAFPVAISHKLCKRTKEKALFMVPFLLSGGTKNETAKSQNHRFGTEEAAHAKA